MADAYIQAANTMIPDKILYASAHPFVDFKEALKKYEQLQLKDDVRQKILYDNAARLLGLKSAPATAAGMEDLVGDIVRQVMARLGR
jgi:predicted TIM-barrel fold metal-dependent hydrolase